jgi:adenylate kinase
MKDSKKPSNFIIIGPPASGKGTQAKLLLEKFKTLHYVYPGEIFRSLFKANTDVGDRIKEIGESGELQSDELATTLWMYEISFNVKRGQGFLLDGSPRKVKEAESLFNFLKFLDKIKTTTLFLINISEKESYKRLTRRVDAVTGKEIKRADDDKERIKLRWSLYRKQTKPAINYMKKGGCRVVEINGEQPIGKVFKDISKHIK